MIAKEFGFAPESKLYRPPAHFLRGCFSRFATGVAVVTFDALTGDGQVKRHGMTVNSFTSVSMDPALVLVSIQKNVKSHELLRERPFTVNILGAEQQALALQFAGKPNREPEWISGGVAPRLAGVLGWFTCTPWAQYPGGDHTLFVGEVNDFDYRTGDMLGFVNGAFTTISESFRDHEALI